MKVKAHGMIMNDDLAGDSLKGLILDALTNALQFSSAEAALYVCLTWRTYAEFLEAIQKTGRAVSACIVWDKKSIGLGTQNYRPQHEFIFYSAGAWHGDKAQADVWSLTRGATGEYVHPTQKPVELVEKAIRNSTQICQIVLDPFGGSGSTMIACERSGRYARLMELDPRYVDVIVKRWQDYTGKEAVHAESGETFNSRRYA